MSRRKATPWAAPGLPDIRRQWCNALDSLVDHQSSALAEPSEALGAAGESLRRLKRLQAKLAETLSQMSGEADIIKRAELYWVSRDMVDVALDAADSLPEWTPAVAAPAPTGLLCWAKPAGRVPWNALSPNDPTEVSWDGVWWWSRPDGVLQIQPLSRLAKNPELLSPYGVSSPLWVTNPTLLLQPLVPRTAEVARSAEASPLVSVVGAAWLLMGQPTVASTRVLGSAPPPQTEESPTAAADPNRVSIIELRRPMSPPGERDGSCGDRQYRHRWWVGGHWRQQACGPNHADRRPKWIAPYVKGPEGAPLKTDRVHVWRR
ncbi:hypothetical protein MCHLDSM_03727 [Mycolicibacterium chlorophenolicum]|uniref:Uncharacterized protein n=1 Tax=Mycolicibacterium chlorophenolicum TaxID=37916 RepID=A0A0J6YPF6_9MYCO|nr:hypothetical protein MCHLDSM_03727 [Mycolicibacterium chlorophenolicum]